MTSYLIAIVKFPLHGTISKIFVNQIKCDKFDLENKDQCEEEKNEACVIRLKKFYIEDFF